MFTNSCASGHSSAWLLLVRDTYIRQEEEAGPAFAALRVSSIRRALLPVSGESTDSTLRPSPWSQEKLFWLGRADPSLLLGFDTFYAATGSRGEVRVEVEVQVDCGMAGVGRMWRHRTSCVPMS